MLLTSSPFVTHLYCPPDALPAEVCITGKAAILADALAEAGDAWMTRAESHAAFGLRLLMSWSTWVARVRIAGVPVRCAWETAHGPVRYGRYSIPGRLTCLDRTGGKP
jgi:hypothetical protein